MGDCGLNFFGEKLDTSGIDHIVITPQPSEGSVIAKIYYIVSYQ